MDRLPILPLGQLVVYPHVVLPMALSDPHAVQLIDEVVQGNKRLLLGIVKQLADFAAANLDLALPAKAELLSIDDVNRRLERLAELLGQELQVLEVGTQIQEKVKSRLDANQREYVLREQLRVIRQELGEDDGDDELDELGRRLDEAGLHAEAKKVSDRELKRLRQMSPQSAEYHVARTYLEVFAR